MNRLRLIRAAHRAVLARRIGDDEQEGERRPSSPVWREKLCAWCGQEFLWKRRNRTTCSDECHRNMLAASQAHGSRQQKARAASAGTQRDKKRKNEARKIMERYLVLWREFGRGVFTCGAAKTMWQMSHWSRAAEILERIRFLGLVRRTRGGGWQLMPPPIEEEK